MNKTLLFLTFLASNVNAQTLEFSYDSSGNQIERRLVVISINSLSQTNSSEQTENEEETLLPKSNSLNDNASIIEFYPNPVVDLLNVEWGPELQLTEIMLFDNLGKLLQVKKVNSGTVRETFNLSTYSSGVYYIRVFDASKQSKSYKIIKK